MKISFSYEFIRRDVNMETKWVHILEHLVSALPRSQMVYTLRVRPGIALAPVLQLLLWRMVASGIPDKSRFRYLRCGVSWRYARIKCYHAFN